MAPVHSLACPFVTIPSVSQVEEVSSVVATQLLSRCHAPLLFTSLAVAGSQSVLRVCYVRSLPLLLLRRSFLSGALFGGKS